VCACVRATKAVVRLRVWRLLFSLTRHTAAASVSAAQIVFTTHGVNPVINAVYNNGSNIQLLALRIGTPSGIAMGCEVMQSPLITPFKIAGQDMADAAKSAVTTIVNKLLPGSVFYWYPTSSVNLTMDEVSSCPVMLTDYVDFVNLLFRAWVRAWLRWCCGSAAVVVLLLLLLLLLLCCYGCCWLS
jgi:hypothetical protein